MEKLPEIKPLSGGPIKPLPGKAIIAFTAEQVNTYNIKLVGDQEFIISDQWFPDQHSIEEAVIYAVSDTQKTLTPGDMVLVDYGIFSSGRHQNVGNIESRLIYKNDEYHLYWCRDGQRGYDSSEILGFIDDYGHCKPFGEIVLIYPHEETEAMIEVISSMVDIHQWPGITFAIVHSSQVPEINEGDIIACEKGIAPEIRFRGITLQYIALPYIIGLADPLEPYGLKLF